MRDAIYLRTLGGLELLGSDGRPVPLQRKHLALLVYLRTEHEREHPRQALERIFWFGSDNPANSLSVALTALREYFPDLPRRTRTVRWAGELPWDVDVLRCAEDSGEARGAAVLSYGGAFLAGFRTGEDASEFQAWKAERQAEYEEYFRQLWGREVTRAGEAGEWARVLELARHGAATDPYWPDSHLWVMRALERLGQADAAVRYQRQLAERAELEDVDLAPELPREAERILSSMPRDEPTRAVLVEENREAPPQQGARELPPAAAGPAPAVSGAPAARRGRRALATAVAGIAAVVVVLGARFRQEGRWPFACTSGAAVGEIVDESYGRGSVQEPGEPFTKAWTLKNAGSCRWSTGFHLSLISRSGGPLSTATARIPLTRSVAPGETYVFTVPMRAPTAPGDHVESWEFRDGSGKRLALGGLAALRAEIVVLPPDVPTCGAGEAVAEMVARSHHHNTRMAPGAAFEMGWSLANRGKCTWHAGTALHRPSKLPARSVSRSPVQAGEPVPPGAIHTFLVPMRAPSVPGRYREDWHLVDPSGRPVALRGLSTISAAVTVPAPGEKPAAKEAPLCGAGGASVRFVGESVPDYAELRPGAGFVKTWTLINSGSCAWHPGYHLHPAVPGQGVLSRAVRGVPVGRSVPPQAAHTFQVTMRAPARSGVWREDWELRDESGRALMISRSRSIWATIYVTNPEENGAGRTPARTPR